ncbi:tyrosine-protein kinase ITK/TSK-like [Sinocyclocheilus anshuiensis]|uniref:Tyrosine-protein kinase n=1 Tax=Sinocyclocheilus anshuiensis TaxID=1608454 RepID=A0A671QEU2_9TELE|nr:PREDICTED: tyrosine-protein kinase ITK/TSK-like [Sinocyclocheilus anshuiensis]
MYPRVILKETLYKKSQQKRRTSPCNYKERIFMLNTQDLTYFEHRPGKKPTQKGCIELSHIKCVEIVRSDAPIPCDYKYPFQVAHDSYYLYVFAPDNDCRLKWVRALKEATQNNNLFLKYHPDFWGEGKWRCCHQTEKLATGCSEYYPNGAKPLPPTPDPMRRSSDPEERIVVALRNFSPVEDTDLPLHKDKEYFVVDSSEPNWWTVRDKDGNVGTVPCIYIAEKLSNNIEKFEWYNKDITRTEAESLLMRENKDGGFIVRDSKHPGVYTVSICSRVAGTNGEKYPLVKHYQIKVQREGEKVMYFLAEKYVFSTIPELIRYHQHNPAGLITRLRHCVTRNVTNSRIKELSSDKWEIHPDEVILSEELGSGQFGLVWKGSWNDRQVAVKTVREGFMSEEEFKEESQVMMKLSHNKLVQLYGVVTQRSPIYLVFEFMENGCLTDFLRARKGHFSQEALLGMCLDVSEGMAYLESSNFIHRDLAARNCLVSEDNVVKISDFGMTRFVLDDQYTSSFGSKFPVRWSSPEVIKFQKYSSKSDVWSFGVLMWEVYSEGRLPYDNCGNAEVVEALNAGLRLLRPRLCPQSVYELMQWSWKEKPEDRPSFALLLHELACLEQEP